MKHHHGQRVPEPDYEQEKSGPVEITLTGVMLTRKQLQAVVRLWDATEGIVDMLPDADEGYAIACARLEMSNAFPDGHYIRSLTLFPEFQPKGECPTCLGGSVISDTCDTCGERHCPDCDAHEPREKS